METNELKEKYPDLVIANLTMSSILSRSRIEEEMSKVFGNNIVRLEHSGKNVTVAYSAKYGEFIEKLTPGTKVLMTGGEIKVNPEYENKVWIVSHAPVIMCGAIACWLDGFSGAYSCEMLKMAE